MKALLLPLVLAWNALTVLHFGDSHVYGGLTGGLREHFQAEGARYYSTHWTSSSTARWAYSQRLSELMWTRRPDVVIVTLGSNEALYPSMERYARHMQRLITRLGDRRCYWIGPPRYERFSVDRIVETQRDNAAPCRYFDSREIDSERTHNNLHFTLQGGREWADAIWGWMNGGEPAQGGEEPDASGGGGAPLAAVPPRVQPLP